MIWKPGFILSCETDFIFDLGQLLILGIRNANTVGSPFEEGGRKSKYRRFNHQVIKLQENKIIMFKIIFSSFTNTL